jgi:hypothetical protein
MKTEGSKQHSQTWLMLGLSEEYLTVNIFRACMNYVSDETSITLLHE